MSNSVFQNVVSEKKRYNNFPLGREVLLTGKIGKLIPVQCDEVVPGDIWRQSAAFLCRFSPLSAPAMARFNVHFHTFYVPYRIITPENSRESTYEKFIKSIGKHKDEVPILPYLYGDPVFRFDIGSLADYLGYPTDERHYIIPEEDRISLMPFLTYQRIYQDFYRRDQLEREIVYPTSMSYVNLSTGDFDGVIDDLDENQDPATIDDFFELRTRNYERDYFTSALPEPQFGDEVAIGDNNISWLTMPENLDIGVNFDGFASILSQEATGGFYENNFTNALWSELILEQGATYNGFGKLGSSQYGYDSVSPNLIAKLQGRTPFTNEMGSALASNLQGNSITINEFRLAMQLQGIKEKINRVGTRYLEIMQGIYGVKVPDARLQRPIFLGGFKNPVSIGSVMQTSQTTDSSPQGTLTGQMISTGTNVLCRGGYEFKEHGYIMTIMSITPRTSYYGGMPRKYMKRYPEEFYLPDFDHLGEQSVYTGELFYNGQNTKREFGYQLRYAELKSALSTVHGEFRTTLDNWHVSRDFDEAPSLNPSFIKADPEDFDRIFAFHNVAGTSNEHFQMQVYIDIVAKRNMSKYSTPYTLY